MKRNIEEVTARRVTYEGLSSTGNEIILKEHNLKLCADGNVLRTIICTDTYIRELCYGYLFSAGLITDPKDVKVFKMSDKRDVVDVLTDDRVKHASGQNYIKNRTEMSFKPEQIFTLADHFKTDKGIHQITSGTHTCILMHEDKIIFSAEDISRHNSIDKVIGYALLNGIRMPECIMFTSGRVQSDVVHKVIKADIPVLVSKSVPTYDAVKAALDAHLVLICSAWSDGYKVF